MLLLSAKLELQPPYHQLASTSSVMCHKKTIHILCVEGRVWGIGSWQCGNWEETTLTVRNDFLTHIYLENVIQSNNKKHLIEEKFQFMLNTFFIKRRIPLGMATDCSFN